LKCATRNAAEHKQNFGFAAIPTNERVANSAWQLISVLTLNLMRHFQIATGAERRHRTWKRTFDYVFQSMQTLRFELIQQPARLVRPKVAENCVSLQANRDAAESKPSIATYNAPLDPQAPPANTVARRIIPGSGLALIREFFNVTRSRLGNPRR